MTGNLELRFGLWSGNCPLGLKEKNPTAARQRRKGEAIDENVRR